MQVICKSTKKIELLLSVWKCFKNVLTKVFPRESASQPNSMITLDVLPPALQLCTPRSRWRLNLLQTYLQNGLLRKIQLNNWQTQKCSSRLLSVYNRFRKKFSQLRSTCRPANSPRDNCMCAKVMTWPRVGPWWSDISWWGWVLWDECLSVQPSPCKYL